MFFYGQRPIWLYLRFWTEFHCTVMKATSLPPQDQLLLVHAVLKHDIFLHTNMHFDMKLVSHCLCISSKCHTTCITSLSGMFAS